jgi:hypothetical protein
MTEGAMRFPLMKSRKLQSNVNWLREMRVNDNPLITAVDGDGPLPRRQAQGPWADLALHTLGWKAFQDLCAQTCEEILKRPVEIFREAQDGGQDAVFLSRTSKVNAAQRPATIQCKFTSKATARLRISDLRVEESHIVSLVADGQADTYILMTNMAVDAPIAAAIKRRIHELGVLHPHVFGREFLARVIRASSKLRALVPRIYGLGDLSTILDERQAEQTKALLGHMLPTLAVYVPTNPHLQAVRALAKHKIVLLLGDPATGKSTIAAILATTASERADHRCYKSDGPEGLLDGWNPNENNGFFWVDDAFGPNQPREDFIDRWIAIMPKVQAAMSAGNRFVLTSRRHIYAAAKPKLGSRNHPLFREGQAIVNVGSLTPSEREQILYNHIKAGMQPALWKSRIKPQLKSLANEPSLLPEIARRLADPAYTRQTTTANDSLLRFIREPKEHLLQTIRELSKLHRAALTLVFLHRGHMPVGASAPDMQLLILSHFSVDSESLGQGILQLRDSFLVQTSTSSGIFWSFKHPTISDAISATLGETEGMAELYLRGTRSDAIIAEAVCVGARPVPDAVVIPEALDDLLVERLAELPDEPWVNRRLFSFLYERTSDQVFRKFATSHPKALARPAHRSEWLNNDPTVLMRARAHALALLRPELRAEIAHTLEESLLDDADTSFLDEDAILALLRPTKLLRLASKIRDRVLAELPSKAIGVAEAEDLDLDLDPADNFSNLRTSLQALESFFADDESAAQLLSDAEAGIVDAIQSVEEKKEEKEEAEREKARISEEEEAHWEAQAPARTSPITYNPTFMVSRGARSIFSDVDE